MAQTSFGVNNPLSNKLWAKRLMREALKSTTMYPLIGSDSNAGIYRKDNLSKAAGDRIRVGLRMQLSGAGVAGDDTLEGNEEALVLFSDDVLIDQLRNAVLSEGRMSEQRVPFSVREEARLGLTDWIADRIDTALINQLSGNTGLVDPELRFSGSNAIVAPDVDHHIFAGGNSTEASVAATSANEFKLSLLDVAVEQAETLTPRIRPFMVGGQRKYVAVMHPEQLTQLRTNTASGQWLDFKKQELSGGRISDNPIYTGAVGEYNNVVMHVNSRIPSIVTDTRRVIFMGAQAGCIAFGQASAGQSAFWNEVSKDYGNKLGVSAGLIWGAKKTRFNSKDFATIVISTYSVSHKDVAV